MNSKETNWIALTLLVLLCVTACSNEEIVDDEEIIPVPTRTMMLKAYS